MDSVVLHLLAAVSMGLSVGCASVGTRCGNGVTDQSDGEQCDDGNQVAADGCSLICQLEVCGNSTLDPAEACDDGNTTGGDGCSAICTVEVCGNAVVDVGEVCDDGNTSSGDGCNAECTSDETCGNSFMDVNEVCDDGNVIAGDGCNADCTSDETCGNNIVDVNEECDDGNVVAGDGCDASCFREGVLYSQPFTAGSIPVTAVQCTEWTAFRAQLTGTFSSITIRGSNDPIGLTCNAPAQATQLCNALNTAATVTNVACNGRTWNVGACGGGPEINAQGSGVCACTNPAYTVRPCINNNNWGGINTLTCASPTQVMEVLCSR